MNTNKEKVARLSKPKKMERNQVIDDVIKASLSSGKETTLERLAAAANEVLSKKGLPLTGRTTCCNRRKKLLKSKTVLDSTKSSLKNGTKPVVQLSQLEMLISTMRHHNLTEVVMKTPEGPVMYRLEG